MKAYLQNRLWLMLLLIGLSLSASAVKSQPADSIAIKGFHLDMRIQVMKLPALKKFVLNLSTKGINTIIMEWEGSYPFVREPLIANRYAYSRQEIAEFIGYCKSLHIQVIPLQQSFGHVEYILRNYKYAALREDQKDFSQVCPSEPELNKKLFTALYTDLVSTHNSPYIHIGGDETYLLGHCEKCKKRAAEIGLSRLYFDHIKMLCDIVVGLGKRPIVWADIALKYPDYINLLPKETIFIDWNYGWDVNRFGDHSKLLKSGYEIWGSPAIRSYPDNYFLTDWQKHFNNIRDFIPLSRHLGYKGIVMTSWSTSGVYSSLFESEDELIDLYAIRHVYPLSGFNMLVDYYLQTLNDDGKLSNDQFIESYCSSHYGFDSPKSKLFTKALFSAPFNVVHGKVIASKEITVGQLLDSATEVLRALKSLQPVKGVQEFRHYLLMADIRIYYLTYMKIEAEINSTDFSGDKIPLYILQLKKLLSNEQRLNDEFTALNKDFLYQSAIDEENLLRNQKIHVLYDRLAKQK
ncbi:Glycosyl hydrolase family 20, catalytic domain [Mucilaginibacter sp. OK268]|uniref:beta-N-acetylhexosaminidase n=1 Tax=Mucilaginibacter sp. OK268 TaxID=1881048 RepID=UPI00088FED53|nr:beta-N-acetylhexosaminidase [Mucilaginibacter sp. OK268]SDP76555.1 Glycosyl hydrolase family 20, catalytic domain [Mucilaginibacter sp. OK268]